MNGSTKNRVKGKLRQAKGKAKEQAGRLTRNTRLEGEGLDDQIAGTIQNVGGKIQGKIQKKLEDK
ncbi:MAG: CsbD family protein [Gemmatimonadales bacterium]